MLESLIEQARGNSVAELIAVAFAVAYLLLAVREHIGCWFAAMISTAIYLLIFIDVRLYMEAALQVFYFGMALYGWRQWTHGGRADRPLAVSTWTPSQHGVAIGVIVAATFLSTWLLSSYTDARLPLLDSFTTWGAVITTFMVARKVLENWIYWLVIDSVAIFLYLDRELYFTALLFAVYIVIIFFGWASWLKSYRQQIA
ncbi:MAG: nicotinamide riboside transporter PnuC [Pseudohongiellaceae bacterium]